MIKIFYLSILFILTVIGGAYISETFVARSGNVVDQNINRAIDRSMASRNDFCDKIGDHTRGYDVSRALKGKKCEDAKEGAQGEIGRVQEAEGYAGIEIWKEAFFTAIRTCIDEVSEHSQKIYCNELVNCEKKYNTNDPSGFSVRILECGIDVGIKIEKAELELGKIESVYGSADGKVKPSYSTKKAPKRAVK